MLTARVTSGFATDGSDVRSMYTASKSELSKSRQGMEQLSKTCFCLVAGGLGERLGRDRGLPVQ